MRAVAEDMQFRFDRHTHRPSHSEDLDDRSPSSRSLGYYAKQELESRETLG